MRLLSGSSGLFLPGFGADFLKETRIMSAPSPAATAWQWPADVLAFAAKENVQQYLEPLLEATQRVFPTARRLEVSLEADPEIHDDWHIDFDVQVPAQDVSDYVAAQRQWIRELYRCCPAPFVCIFRLGLEPVP
jgi:hypothetical protein